MRGKFKGSDTDSAIEGIKMIFQRLRDSGQPFLEKKTRS